MGRKLVRIDFEQVQAAVTSVVSVMLPGQPLKWCP